MEPRYWMSLFCALALAGVAGLAARGLTAEAVGASAVVLSSGLALDLSYLIRRDPARTLKPRRTLDRIVRMQWICLGVGGMLLAVGLGPLAGAPLEHPGVFAEVVVAAVTIAFVGIYVSSLVDWYVVLPTISGQTGVAPCAHAGGEQFATVTKVWFFHRACATTLITFVLAGIPAYLASVTDDPSDALLLALLGSALAVGYTSVTGGLIDSFKYAMNPRFFVGDTVRVRVHPEDGYLSDAYVVDVSIQGFKAKPIDRLESDAPCFRSKGELFSIGEIASTSRAAMPRRACPSVAECHAANWYCFRNQFANEARGSGESEPIDWPPA